MALENLAGEWSVYGTLLDELELKRRTNGHFCIIAG